MVKSMRVKVRYNTYFTAYGFLWGALSSIISVISVATWRYAYEMFPSIGNRISKDIIITVLFAIIYSSSLMLWRNYFFERREEKLALRSVSITKIFGSIIIITIGKTVADEILYLTHFLSASPQDISNISTILLLIACFSYLGLFFPHLDATFEKLRGQDTNEE